MWKAFNLIIEVGLLHAYTATVVCKIITTPDKSEETAVKNIWIIPWSY